MADFSKLEATFQKYAGDLGSSAPAGVIQVNLALLHQLGLLGTLHLDREVCADTISNLFHVMESPEKITLYNDRFIVWIVPEIVSGKPITYALVAVNNPETTQLELAFTADGIYNTSRIVLRVLERLLEEVQNTEQELSKIN